MQNWCVYHVIKGPRESSRELRGASCDKAETSPSHQGRLAAAAAAALPTSKTPDFSP
ncbi:hypothetical protein E4U42_003603, partial [Claviceps africana]